MTGHREAEGDVIFGHLQACIEKSIKYIFVYIIA